MLIKRVLISTVLLVLIFAFMPYGFSASNKTVLVDDFNTGVFSNLLGGYLDFKKTPPGICRLEFVSKEGLTFGNSGNSLKVSFDVKEKNSFAYFWIKLGKEDNLGRITSTSYLEDCNYLSFWIRGDDKFDSNIKLELHQDINSDRRFNIKEDVIAGINLRDFLKERLSGNWEKVMIPISAFKEISNLTKVLELVFVFEHSNTGNNTGEIFIDELLFGYIDKSYLSAKKTIPLNSPNIDTFRINRTKISKSSLLRGVVELSIDCKGEGEDQGLESVRFEYSPDGINWRIIGFDYDRADISYKASLDTFSLAPDKKYFFRAISTAADGREAKTEMIGPVGIYELTDEEILLKIEERAFNFFKDNQSEATGLFLDNSYDSYSSISSTGFGLAALAIGAKNGWINKEEARERAYKTIDTFLTDPKNKSKVVAEGRDGFCHFLDADTARRFSDCEISTVDMAILVSGAIACGEYFGNKVKIAADRLYSSIRWDRFLDKTSKEHYNHFYMGWFPDGRFLDSWWDYYTDEAMLIALLGIGSTSYRVSPEVFYSFKREKAAYAKGEPFVISWHGALFTYQYAHGFFDFRDLIDKENIDWFRNSISATLANRGFCIDNSDRFSTFGPNSWGITSMRMPNEYIMHYGVPPCGSKNPIFNGTISPTGPAGSMPFTPFVSLDALRYLLYYNPQLWGKYGLKDSFNLDTGFYSGIYYGLGAGITLIMIENARTSFVWDAFMKKTNVRRAIKLAGFKNAKTDKPLRSEFDEQFFLKELTEANSFDKYTDVFEKIWNAPKTAFQFKNFLSVVSSYINSISDKKKTDLLRYFLARTYIKEIEKLRKDSTLDSFRRYLKDKPLYYTEADSIISQLLNDQPDKELMTEILFMKLLINIGRYRYSEAEETIKKVATSLKVYSDNPSTNISKLNILIDMLEDLDLQEYALKMKTEFINISDKKTAQSLLENLKKEAQDKFDLREYRGSLGLYTLYFDIKTAKAMEGLQDELKEIADRFYSAKKWHFARALYQILTKLPNSNLVNYAHFSIAKTFEAEADFDKAKAEYEILIKTVHYDEWSDKTYAELGKIYYTTSFNNIDYSIKSIRELINIYPKNPETIRLKTYLAELYYAKKDLTNSLNEYKSILNKYPSSTLSALIKENIKNIENELSKIPEKVELHH